MAALGGALLSSVLQKSPAEKALSPWWDRVQDYVTYGMIMISKLLFIHIYLEFKRIFTCAYFHLGLLALPSTLALGTSLDCTPCTDELCPDIEFGDSSNKSYSSFWLKKYCTCDSGAVNSVLMFFPLLILIIPTILHLSETGFQVIH